MFLYFLILFYWIVLFVFKKRQSKNSDLFWAILPLFLIMALKSVSVGCDTISYYNRYIVAEYMLVEENTKTEIGYNLVSYFFHDILGVPFFVFYFFYSAFVCFVMALFLKHFSPNIYLSLFIYMTIGLFTPSMSGMRQMTAISICTIPIIWAKICEDKGLEKRMQRIRRLIVSILLVLMAYTFHNSAVVFLPVFFFLHMRLSRAQIIRLMILLLVSSLLLRNVFVSTLGYFVIERYEKYELTGSYAMNILMLLVPIVISLFCVIVSRPKNGERTYSKAFSIMFVFLTLQVLFNNLALINNQIARLGYYFMNSYIILIPYALKKMPSDIRNVVTISTILLCLVFFYLGTDGGTLAIDNYKFFWEEPLYLKN